MKTFDVEQVEKLFLNLLGKQVFRNKKIDDFLLTGKADVERPTYRCCDHKVAEKMVELAEINESHTVLEPSAGKGVILKLLTKFPKHSYLEVNEHFVDILGEVSREFRGFDFLSYYDKCDRIVMNPPFAFNQYQQHILHAYSLLNEGGILVTLLPEVAYNLTTTNKELLKLLEVGEKIEAGNVCGENTSCVILKLNKK